MLEVIGCEVEQVKKLSTVQTYYTPGLLMRTFSLPYSWRDNSYYLFNIAIITDVGQLLLK